MILGTYFLDKHVHAILLHRGEIVMNNMARTTVPLIGRSRLPPSPKKRILSEKVKCARITTLPARSQTWVEVVTEQKGDVMIDHHSRSFSRYGVGSQHAIARVRSNVLFKIMLASFGDKNVELAKKQIVAHMSPSLTKTLEAPVSFMEVRGITQEPNDATAASKVSSLTAENKDVEVMDRVDTNLVPRANATTQ